jgi:DNA-binding MarR family transcriptional regulator
MTHLDGAAEPEELERQRLLQAQACANMRLRRATRALSDFYDRVLAPSGLHGNQFTLLIPPYLQPGLTINQLAQFAGLDRTTLARNLKLLQARQLITISAGRDQRTRLIQLTQRGRQVVRQALPLWEQAQQQVIATLGQGQLSQLFGYLDKLEALEASPETPPVG